MKTHAVSILLTNLKPIKVYIFTHIKLMWQWKFTGLRQGVVGASHNNYEHEIRHQHVKAPQVAAISRLLISSHPPHPWMNEVLILHAYHSLMALYTREHEIGRQHVKAPQAAVISTSLISTHPPHPWMNLRHWQWSQPQFKLQAGTLPAEAN